MSKLYVLIAKSAIRYLSLLPKEAEVIVADFSRYAAGNSLSFWSQPKEIVYDEIVIVDANVVTALTLRHIENALRAQGITGRFCYAGNPRTLMGYQHLDYIMTETGLVEKSEQFAPELDRYLLAITGLPAAGKSLLRKLFEQMGLRAYKWGNFAVRAAETRFGNSADPYTLAKRFFNEVERQDRLATAKYFLENSGVEGVDDRLIVLDGVKSIEQVIYVSYALRRPMILVAVRRDETERKQSAAERGDLDDAFDQERLEILRQMGVNRLIGAADFVVDTTGCRTVIYDGVCQVRFTQTFVRGLGEVMLWLGMSNSLSDATEAIIKAAEAVAVSRKYLPDVEVLDAIGRTQVPCFAELLSA